MHDRAQMAVTALAGATTQTVGRFRFDVATDTWWWSPNLYVIHGFTQGEVVPTTELMATHQHPGDRPWSADMLTAAVADGKAFCSRHRIMDSRQRERTVVTVAEGVRDTDDRLVQVCGYLIDVTDSVDRDLAAATPKAVEQSAESRATIEQAKGALMITYGLADDEAFALLRWYSQNANIKLRDLAATITEHINDPHLASLSAPAKLAEILSPIIGLENLSETVPGEPESPDDSRHRISAQGIA